ncbi:MAG TPA: FAD-dependent oxidoreductase [Steroidobacteraceae bacterium]|nr:FAD-dependent oxidoreductase [Steroidobacteraceae bacterium]
MKEYDVIVVGGGIHGAGVLQAAAAAGYRGLLIEKRTLASATSRRSSNLIHGGLRYLESGQFAPTVIHGRALSAFTAANSPVGEGAAAHVLSRIAPSLERRPRRRQWTS